MDAVEDDVVGRDQPERRHVQARRVGGVGEPGCDRDQGISLQLDRRAIEALRHTRIVGYLSREQPAPEAVHHLGLQLAGHAPDDGRGGHRPHIREPLLQRDDAEEVV
jgi:hypothetical protein